MRELLEIGKRGMFAGQRSLDVIGQNIANAATPGYTRQRADLVPLDYKSNGMSIGLGVNVAQVTQLRDSIIDAQVRQKEGEVGEFNEKIKVYEQLEVLFASGADNDLDKLITSFFNSFSELSNNPESLALRENVLFSAQNLTTRFGELSTSLDEIQNSLVKDSTMVIDEVNRLTADIARLNVAIANGASTGQPDNYSLDLRNQRLNDLAQYVDVNVIYDSTGMAEVRMGNIVVVQSGKASVVEPEFDSVNNVFRLRLNNGRTVKDVGGKLGASVEVYSQVLPSFKEKLDSLAQNVVEKVNALHVNGFDLNGNTGNEFFDSANTTASTISISSFLANDVSRIAASDTAGANGNSTVARNIFGLIDSTSAVGDKSFIEYSLSISSETGFALNNLRTRVESAESSKLMLESQQEEISGVNMDEELANMIKFQNAYQASARVIATVQDMYDTVLSLI
ncbi:flagellar hook-associated protein FlgK [bacterium]|nr:MAG: flagellar hook-associated protein FlgK [bacterium]